MSGIPEQESRRSVELEQEKERLIRRYLELQDLVDEYNEQVYRVCCEIEALNLKIKAVQEEERLAQARASGAITTQVVKN